MAVVPVTSALSLDWRFKGVFQKILSYVPGGVWMNDQFQLLVGEMRHFERTVESKVVDDWLILMDALRDLNRTPSGLELMEIGAGWFPTLPLCFSLAGAKRCLTLDISRHLNAQLTFRLLGCLEVYLERIAQAAGRPLPDVQADYTCLRGADGIDDLFERARITYLAPADAVRTGLPENSIDVVFSNSVLEHVPPGVIRGMLLESRRILRRGGVSLHAVNCGDHYAYFDRRITPINYLTFSEREWRFWNNRLLYQNRSRPRDFKDMAEECDLNVVYYTHRVRPELHAFVSKMKIAHEFRGYDADQLCSTSVLFGAVKPPAVA